MQIHIRLPEHRTLPNVGGHGRLPQMSIAGHYDGGDCRLQDEEGLSLDCVGWRLRAFSERRISKEMQRWRANSVWSYNKEKQGKLRLLCSLDVPTASGI